MKNPNLKNGSRIKKRYELSNNWKLKRQLGNLYRDVIPNDYEPSLNAKTEMPFMDTSTIRDNAYYNNNPQLDAIKYEVPWFNNQYND